MSLVKVDPKPFVTCRLCLDDMGQYQIVPAVQQKIKFCFDIDVEPFDGPPQLICNKCEVILDVCYKIKNTYLDKHNDIKKQFWEDKPEVSLVAPKQETVTSTQQNDNETTDSPTPMLCKKSRAVITSSSSDSDSAGVMDVDENVENCVTRKSAKNTLWYLNFDKLFACRICKTYFKKICDFNKHKYTHFHLKEKYDHILNNKCKLILEKLDRKPNFTGRNTVVHSNSKIIEEGGDDYFIIYVPKYLDHNITMVKGAYDSDDNFVMKRKCHRKYLLSKSSNDMLVIDLHKNRSIYDNEKNIVKPHSKNQNEGECINIEYSYDSSCNQKYTPLKSPQSVRKYLRVKFNDNKTIQNIVTMCQNRYNNKFDRIMARTINKIENLENNDRGWENNVNNVTYMEPNYPGPSSTLSTKFNETAPIVLNTNLNIVQTKARTINKVENLENNDGGWINVTIMEPNEPATIVLPNTVLSTDVNINGTITKNKLLNANPVANPKQLPKKPIGNAIQNVISIGNGKHMDDVNFCMPIITSTTSLAPIQSTEIITNENKVESEKTENQQISEVANNITLPGIIKVKPVSELISERVLNNLIKENSTSSSNLFNQDQHANSQVIDWPATVMQNPKTLLKMVQVQGGLDNT